LSGSGGPRQGEGSELDILLLAGGILFALWLIYFFFHREIVHALFFLKYHELSMLNWIMPNAAPMSHLVYLGYEHPSSVTLSTLLTMSQEVGNLLKYPFSVVALLLALVLYFSHPDRLYAEFEKMPSLASKMASTFPAIQVVEGLDLVNTPIDEGPWAMAKTPIEWGMNHRLLSRDPVSGQVVVDRLKAKLVFSLQLGVRWRGYDELKMHEKAIFVALAAFVNYARDEAEAFLEQIARSVTQEKLKKFELDWSGLDKMASKYLGTPAVQAIMSGHAYVYTVFVELLRQARTSGIVANSLYLWLKPVDRKLWYVLNSVGRKAVFVEVGGIFAHWLVESQLKMAIGQALVEEAVNGLEEAVKIRVIKGL
jgi:intracellular multiplication protein IcmP